MASVMAATGSQVSKVVPLGTRGITKVSEQNFSKGHLTSLILAKGLVTRAPFRGIRRLPITASQFLHQYTYLVQPMTTKQY